MSLLIHEQPLTIGETATILATYPAKLRRYEAAGRIPPARRTPVSGERFWLRSDLPTLRRLLSGQPHTGAA